MAQEEVQKIKAFDPIGYCGMMYDSRTKKFIPGLKLEHKPIEEIKCGSIKSDILTEKEYYEKKSNLNVSGSLKFDFSILSGEMSGSYTSDQTSSKNKEKMYLDCNIMTKHVKAIFDLESQSLEKNRQVISSGLGTHVVAAIEYGGNAVIEFELDTKSENSSYAGEGSLNASLSTKVKELGSITAKGGMSGHENDSFEKVKIKFAADFTMEEMPTKLEQCMNVYQQISKYAGEGKPYIMHLLPLSFFEVEVPKALPLKVEVPKASPLDQEIVDRALEVRQTIDKKILECKAFLEDETSFRFPAFKKEVEAAVTLAKRCLQQFSARCSKIMRKIEFGETGERELQDHIEQHERSPFQEEKFTEYLEMLEDWKEILAKCHMMLTSSKKKIVFYEDKAEALEFIMKKEVVVCFKLEIPKKSQFQEDMHSSIRQNTKDTAAKGEQNKNPEFHKDVTTFLRLAAENKNENRHCFYFSKTRQSTNILKHAVEVYQNGSLISDPDFKLPCQVTGIFAQDISDCSATIFWEDLGKSTGKTFEVEINNQSEEQENHVMGQFTIKEGQTGICLKDLHTNTKYEVAVRLSGASIENLTLQGDDAKVFNSAFSEPFLFRTKLPSPRMSELGDNRFRVSWNPENKYIWEVEITKAKVTILKEKIQKSEEQFDFTLEGDGSYQITVSVYNEDGTCRERYPSTTMNFENSNQLQNLRAELKQNAPVKSKDKPTVYLLPMQDKLIKARKGKQIGTFRPYMEERIVLVLGTTSEGRKRWMNLLVSGLLGVKAVHEYYFAVSMESTAPGEKTLDDGSGIIVYRICQVDGFHVPYTLTIIDTNDLPPEALQTEKTLCKHISTILYRLGPGFNHVDAITIVQGKDSKLEDFKPEVTSFYQSHFGEHVENNITFVTHDEPVELEVNLNQQRDYLQALASCTNSKCRRWRFRLWHSCGKIQNSLIQSLWTENQRLHVLKDTETEGTKYEELFPEVKALSCMNCVSTCQPFCTDEEGADKKKCAVIEEVPKDPNPVFRCIVCPEECEMKHHRLEGAVIVENSSEVEVTIRDIIARRTDSLVSSVIKGKQHEDILKTEIQKGLKIFLEFRPERSVKDFFNLLQAYVSDDNKASKESCMHWIKKQKEDPGAMKSWESGHRRDVHRCETCFEMYDQNDCLAKVQQNNFLVPPYDKATTGNMAERLSPMQVWDKTKHELKLEKNSFSFILQAFEFQHATICQCTETAKKILATDNPRKVKALADGIPKQPKLDELWDIEKDDVLLAIIQAAVRNKDFNEALAETGSRTIGYLGGPDDYWGTGLDRKHSQNLNPRMWTSLNKYGELLMQVRESDI